MAVIAAAALTMSACAPAAPITPSPEPPVTSVAPTPSVAPSQSTTPDPPPSPDPTPSPTPSSTLNEEQAAAVATVMEYFRLLNELSKNPEMDVQPLADITTGQSQTLDIGMIKEDREAGIIQTGDNFYSVTEVDQVAERGDVRVVNLQACTDSTATDLIDQSGKSVLGPDRAFFVDWNIDVLHDGLRWKVADITNGSVDKCSL